MQQSAARSLYNPTTAEASVDFFRFSKLRKTSAAKSAEMQLPQKSNDPLDPTGLYRGSRPLF
jgi:hypothetical protein